MKNKTQNIKIPKRKIIILSIFFIVIPIFVLVTLFVTTYVNNKIEPFPNTTATYTTVKKIDSFDFDFYCSEYNVPTKGSSTTTMKFKAAVSNKKTNHEIKNIKYKLVMGSNWNGNKTSSVSSSELTFSKTDTKNYVTTSITNFNFKYPDRVLLFINIKAPTVYVNLTWTETKNGSTTQETKNYIITYDFEDYFIKGVTI